MFRQWKEDPKSVHISWQVYFDGMENKGLASQESFRVPPTLMPLPVDAPPVDMSGMGKSTENLDDHLKVSG